MAAYVTYSEGNTYFSTQLNTGVWDRAADVDKTKALTMATAIIDRLAFYGDKANPAQANQFPRDDDTTVPQNILDACCEIAIALLANKNPDREFQNLFVESEKIEGWATKYDRSRHPEHVVFGVPSVTAWRLLKPYLRDYNSFNLERVS